MFYVLQLFSAAPNLSLICYANVFSGFQSWPALFCIWWFLWRGIPFSLRPKLPNSIGALHINFQKILQNRDLPGRAPNSQAAIKERRAGAVQDGAVGLGWPEFNAKPFNIPIAVVHLPYPLLCWIPDDSISLPCPSNVSVQLLCFVAQNCASICGCMCGAGHRNLPAQGEDSSQHHHSGAAVIFHPWSSCIWGRSSLGSSSV